MKDFEKTSINLRGYTELHLILKNLWILILVVFSIIYFPVVLFRNLIFYYIEPSKEKIWDLGFELLPETDKDYLQNLPQWFVWTSTLIFVLFAVFNKKVHLRKEYGMVRFLSCYSLLLIMHLIRVFNYHSTRISSPTSFCMNLRPDQKPEKIQYIFYKIYNKSCGDLIFSGHNSNMMIILLSIRSY